MTWRDSVNAAMGAAWTKPLVFAFCLFPVACLAWKGLETGAGASLTELAVRRTGDWTLNFLLLTLAVSPVREMIRLPNLARFRRMLGLFSFFYGCLHLFAWKMFHHMTGVIRFSRWNLRFAFLGFVLMIPLALTSTAAWIRWLGGKRWRMLHGLIYVSTIVGVAHYCGLAKPEIEKPLVYCAIVVLLLVVRIPSWKRVSE